MPSSLCGSYFPVISCYDVWLQVGLEAIFDPFRSLFPMVLVPTIKQRSLCGHLRFIMRQWAFDICRDSGKKIDALVAEIGIGGSITGARKFFKQKNPDIKYNVLVEG
ncbi:Tryptophan synthase beta subunit-like PLP-dependent enzyme [Vigna unguiculata]|uniref:Tryptophan synthase beta subunit-like PLP-dependent enzyme n=1 Tax=Vigna unguiculata TaxID=3917 RepID=A0A4D6LDA0_VIGUN|nr:Tryptophan synthase beta subunit-like PLP-dependent enzyme [Vigna unguiculata]